MPESVINRSTSDQGATSTREAWVNLLAVGKYDTAVAAPNIFLLDLDFFEAFGTDAVSVLNTAGSDKGNIQGKLLQGLDGLFPGIRHFGFIIFSAQCVKSVLCSGDTVHDGMRVGDDQSVLHSTQIGSQQCDSASGIHSDNAVFSGNKLQCFFGNLVFGEKIFLLTAN